MTDDPIRLRDVTLADASPLLDRWAASPETRGEFNDFGPGPGDRSRWSGRIGPPVRSATSATAR